MNNQREARSKILRSVVFVFLSAIFLSCASAYAPWKAVNPSNLAQDREFFPTKLQFKKKSPVMVTNDQSPEGTTAVLYSSGNLALKAWLSNLPNDGGKHPAIVFAHGGFSLDKEDWPNLKPYLESGFIVLMPSFRGENGNPGNFEFFFGEVSDLIAAGEYLATNASVDRDRIFLVGHSNGGTLAMLAALMPSPYRKIASFSGSPDQEYFFRTLWKYGTPFPREDPREIALRSPIIYAASLRKPLYLFSGSEEVIRKRNGLFAMKAVGFEKECEHFIIPGNHFSALPSAISKSIQLFKSPEI